MVDTLHAYRSPVRLVLHAAEDLAPYSPQALARARKKMMAEIALGGDEVVLDEILYARNDAATLLENLSEEAWRAHCTVYTFSGLLQFLEKQTFDHEALKKADACLYDPRLAGVVSPFFAFSFNAVSGDLLRQQAYDRLVQLLLYQGYILPDHQHEAFQKIRNYLDELNYTLRNLSWEKFSADESILHFVFETEWRSFLNALPPVLTTLRDELVNQLIQIVLRFQQKATWYYLHQVLVNLKGVETNDYNRFEIERIDKVMVENTRIESRSGKKDGVSLRVIWWGIWVALMFVRMATCNNSSSNFAEDYIYNLSPQLTKNVAEQANEQKLVQKLDSVLHAKPRRVHREDSKAGEAPFPFAEDSRMAVNDSLLVVNNTGYDAVFLYCKDLPGHALEGRLPKLYANLIRKGQSEKVYVLPGNGRVYFAFGNHWGKLEEPFSIPFAGLAGAAGNDDFDALTFNHFFGSAKGIHQTFLLNPLLVSAAALPEDDSTPQGLPKGEPQSVLFLTTSNAGFGFESRGPLNVRAANRQK